MDASHSGKEIVFSTISQCPHIFQSLYGNVFTDLKRRRREADDNLLDFGDIQSMMKYILAIHE